MAPGAFKNWSNRLPRIFLKSNRKPHVPPPEKEESQVDTSLNTAQISSIKVDRVGINIIDAFTKSGVSENELELCRRMVNYLLAEAHRRQLREANRIIVGEYLQSLLEEALKLPTTIQDVHRNELVGPENFTALPPSSIPTTHNDDHRSWIAPTTIPQHAREHWQEGDHLHELRRQVVDVSKRYRILLQETRDSKERCDEEAAKLNAAKTYFSEIMRKGSEGEVRENTPGDESYNDPSLDFGHALNGIPYRILLVEGCRAQKQNAVTCKESR